MERPVLTKKKEEVKKLTEKLEKAVSFYIVDYTGLDANKMNALRRKFSERNFEYFVIKNSILERAGDKLDFEEITNILVGPNAISISYDDPVGPAKIINEFYKETKLLSMKLCYIEGEWFSKKDVRIIAELPSKEVLISQFLSLISSPLNQFVTLLRNIMCNFVRVLDEIRKVKGKEESGEEREETEKGDESEESTGEREKDNREKRTEEDIKTTEEEKEVKTEDRGKEEKVEKIEETGSTEERKISEAEKQENGKEEEEKSEQK